MVMITVAKALVPALDGKNVIPTVSLSADIQCENDIVMYKKFILEMFGKELMK